MSEIAVAVEEGRPDALPTFEAEDFESHVYAFRQVSEEIEERLWMLAAIAASVSSKYGERSIPDFAQKVGKSPRRIYELAYTYRAWYQRDRAQDLSFKHHTVAARRDPENPERPIERAIQENLSANKLEETLIAEEEPQNVEVVHDTRVCPTCNGSGEVPA